MLAKAAEQGDQFKIGCELEYFLVELNADGIEERRRTIGSRWRPSRTRSPCCRVPTTHHVGAPVGRRLRVWE